MPRAGRPSILIYQKKIITRLIWIRQRSCDELATAQGRTKGIYKQAAIKRKNKKVYFERFLNKSITNDDLERASNVIKNSEKHKKTVKEFTPVDFVQKVFHTAIKCDIIAGLKSNCINQERTNQSYE